MSLPSYFVFCQTIKVCLAEEHKDSTTHWDQLKVRLPQKRRACDLTNVF